MFCLFVRFLPMVATAEVKTVLPQADPHGHTAAAEGHEGRGYQTVLPTHPEPAGKGAS
jgi:molybdopterin-containing oxidoreductase family membrane subunit